MTTTTILYNTEKYQVELADGRSIIGEDGKYTQSHGGYVVVNKETGVTEHSTTMLPGAIFQCQHFNDTLVDLLRPADEAEVVNLQSVDVPERS